LRIKICPGGVKTVWQSVSSCPRRAKGNVGLQLSIKVLVRTRNLRGQNSSGLHLTGFPLDLRSDAFAQRNGLLGSRISRVSESNASSLKPTRLPSNCLRTHKVQSYRNEKSERLTGSRRKFINLDPIDQIQHHKGPKV
jgi:hypothetical protein